MNSASVVAYINAIAAITVIAIHAREAITEAHAQHLVHKAPVPIVRSVTLQSATGRS